MSDVPNPFSAPALPAGEPAAAGLAVDDVTYVTPDDFVTEVEPEQTALNEHGTSVPLRTTNPDTIEKEAN